MYNRNINRLTAVIQSPIAPRSTNVLWDDLVSNTLKVYRKGIWTVIGGAGGGGEGSSLYWGYDETQGVIFPLEQRSVQINGDLTVNGDITARKLSVAELEIDGKSFASYWELDSNTNTLSTTYQVLIKNSLIVEQDTSSGGEGQDTPAAGLDEQAILDLLEREKYVTEDDIEGLIPDVDLSEYAKTEDVETAISEVGEEIDSLSTLLSSMWHLDENGNLVTDKQVLIQNNLIIDGDTSSGGEGEDTPSGSGGVSEEDVLNILQNNGYITQSQSDARYLALSGGTISGDTDALKIVRNTNGYSAITYYNTQNGATTLLGVMGFDSNGEPSAYRASDNVWRTLIHSGNIGSYNAGGAKKLTPYNGICDYAAGISTMSFFTDWGLTNTLGSYLYGISMESPDASYKVQVGHALWKGLYWRDMDAGTWTSWKKIVTENADGNVGIGIGTTSPLSKLQVGGQINVSHNSNKNYAFISQDDYTSNTSWMKLGTCYGYQTEAVAMTIYNGMVKIGNAIPTCELDVNGAIKATKPILGYMYGTNNNAAAFIFDKPGLNYTGIGSDGVSDTIRFGACDINGTWVSYNQKWKFYGDVIVSGAIVPSSNAYTLGTYEYLWSSVWSHNGKFINVNTIEYYKTALTSAGWKKVAIDNKNLTSSNVIINIKRIYNNTNNETYTFLVNCAYDGQTTITQIGGHANYIAISQIAVYNPPAPYDRAIYIYYNTSAANEVIVNCIGDFDAINPEAATLPSSNVKTMNTTSTGFATTGNAVIAGDTSSGSDIRFKDVIKNKTLKIEHIAKAPLFTFKWNDREDDTIHLGSSAQYWENIAPWLVKGEDFKTLDYSTLGVAMGISLAKKAVNHEERIKELERKVKSLEEENRRLRYGN